MGEDFLLILGIRIASIIEERPFLIDLRSLAKENYVSASSRSTIKCVTVREISGIQAEGLLLRRLVRVSANTRQTYQASCVDVRP